MTSADTTRPTPRHRRQEVRLADTDVRYIVCHNPEQAERDRTQREEAVSRLQAELTRIAAAGRYRRR